MPFLLGYILKYQSMRRLQKSLMLLIKVPKARLEQESQGTVQEAYCFEQAEGICALSWQALE